MVCVVSVLFVWCFVVFVCRYCVFCLPFLICFCAVIFAIIVLFVCVKKKQTLLVGMNHDIKREKDKFTNELITKHFDISNDPDNIIHTKPNHKHAQPQLKAPGFEYQAELVVKTMESIKNESNNSRYVKNFHQTGFTFEINSFISQITGKLDNSLVEFQCLSGLNVSDAMDLEPEMAAHAKGGSKRGRKVKDVGKSSRKYSKNDARNIKSLVSSNILNRSDAGFDREDYYSSIEKTAIYIFDFLKYKFGANVLPIKKCDNITNEATETRKKMLKYLHCIDIERIHASVNGNEKNGMNSNNNNSNNAQDFDFIDVDALHNNLERLEKKIGLEEKIWKWKVANGFKVDKAKESELKEEYLKEINSIAKDLQISHDLVSAKKNKENQKFKMNEVVKKNHTIMEYLIKK